MSAGSVGWWSSATKRASGVEDFYIDTCADGRAAEPFCSHPIARTHARTDKQTPGQDREANLMSENNVLTYSERLMPAEGRGVQSNRDVQRTTPLPG